MKDMTQQDSSWVNTFVFVAGFLLGVGTAIFLTPETGSQFRTRLARGVRTAQDEFSDLACEAKEAMQKLSDEAKKTMKQAATRVDSAVNATKQAVKIEPANE